MEIPPLSVSFYIETAMECQPWSSRNKSMFEVLSIIAQAVWTVRQENRQGSPAYFQPEGPARTWARPRRNSISPIRSRCGSKNTGNCFRFVSSCSRVQRPGVHRRHRRWQGARPTRYRTDRGKSKKRQESRQGLKSPELQGFLALQGSPVPGKQPETAADANGRSAPI